MTIKTAEETEVVLEGLLSFLEKESPSRWRKIPTKQHSADAPLITQYRTSYGSLNVTLTEVAPVGEAAQLHDGCPIRRLSAEMVNRGIVIAGDTGPRIDGLYNKVNEFFEKHKTD